MSWFFRFFQLFSGFFTLPFSSNPNTPMPTEMINPPKKAPGNSILKSLSAEKQQDIAQHAREHTLEQTREYLVSRHQITASLPTIS